MGVSATAKGQIEEANARSKELEETLQTRTDELTAKQGELEASQKEVEELKKTHEEQISQARSDHGEAIGKLEKGFAATLDLKSQEVENLQIVSNKYKKKNESLSKDVRSLLQKLETLQQQQAAQTSQNGVVASTPSSRASTPGGDAPGFKIAMGTNTPTAVGPPTHKTLGMEEIREERDTDSVSSLPVTLKSSQRGLLHLGTRQGLAPKSQSATRGTFSGWSRVGQLSQDPADHVH